MEGWYRRPRVVVVGAGVAGSLLAKSIQFHTDVVLIDPKEYFEIPWANVRSKVEPTAAQRSLISHSDYLTDGKIVTSHASGVTETEVLTVEGRRFVYDYLVIAAGHTVTAPRSRRDRLEQFQEENVKIANSNSVLIIGGGPTGVELAGEIAFDYPDKKVILVHSGERLLEFLCQKASRKALAWLRSKNVEVYLGASIDMDSITEADRVFTTSAGETITADSYFVCVDRPLSSTWLQNSCLNEYVDRNGRLMVDKHFRVGGLNNVFAIGDITYVPELKQGVLAQRHAYVVAKNLKLLIKGKENKLVKYRPGPLLAMISLGRKDALAQFSSVTMVGFLPGLLKSRDLFVRRTRKQMGLDLKQGSIELLW